MKSKHWIWLRRASQGFFLFLFLWFLFLNRPGEGIENFPLVPTGPIRFFFLLNPLLSLSLLLGGNLPGAGFLWSLLVVAGTVLVGRFFCGFLCPLGTINQMASQGVHNYGKGSRYRFIKYGLLSAFIVSCLAGLNVAGLVDPLSLIYRSFALLLLPGLSLGLQKLSGLLHSFYGSFFSGLSDTLELMAMKLSGWKIRFYQAAWLTGTFFMMVVLLNRVYPRFWCRFLCPLGALLALLSRFSLMTIKRREEDCTHCGLCTRNCQSDANPEPGGEGWRRTECILCLRCMHKCPEEVISFSFSRVHGEDRTFGVTRRTLLTGAVVGLSLPLMARMEGLGFEIPRDRLIRPPGSIPEPEFLSRCYRCGICMKICPTNVLQPAFSEAGLSGIWTPVLVMAFGYCEHTCTACSTLCPTGAIAPITVEEKIGRPIRIGSAYIERGICLPWSQNIPCIVCEEHCPTSPKAIYLERKTIKQATGELMEIQLPHVDLTKCTGCGICEYKCPVKSRPAIRVTSSGESRSETLLILR